jgi:DNA-binding beta-propeller fold protein YncE
MMFLALIVTLLQAETALTLIVESSQQLFGRAVSMTATADRRIIVADQDDHTVKIVSAENTITQSIGGKGWGTDSFDLPGDVSASFLLDLFVTDNNNRRVQRYDKQMQFVHGYDEESLGEIGKILPVACATALSGEIFILDADSRRVIRLNPRSAVEKEFGNFTTTSNSVREPKDIAVSTSNEIFVLDGSRVLVFDFFGNFIRTIALTASSDWKTLSVSGHWLLVTASDRIRMIDTETLTDHTIVPASIIGEKITEPFSDAMIVGEQLLLLTPTNLYRCSFNMP